MQLKLIWHGFLLPPLSSIEMGQFVASNYVLLSCWSKINPFLMVSRGGSPHLGWVWSWGLYTVEKVAY